MPLADKTAVANLALDHLGEPYLDDYDNDTGTTADAVRLHMDQCVETVLESHVWSFATRCATLVADPFATAILNGAGNNNALLFTAVEAGPDGDEITVEIAAAAVQATTTVEVTDTAIVITPGTIARMIVTGASGNGSGTFEWNATLSTWDSATAQIRYTSGQWLIESPDYVASKTSAATTPAGLTSWTVSLGSGQPTVAAGISSAAQAIAALEADEDAAALVTVENSGNDDGTGALATVAETALSGGTVAPAFGSSFILPADCLRLLKIDGQDPDVSRNDFEIMGRYLLLNESDADAPVIHYIIEAPPVDEWPTTFTDAVAFLLASRLAPKIAGDQALAGALLQKHELALGKARSKDARETRSKENAGPRQLAARSGLVRARYGNPLPPY